MKEINFSVTQISCISILLLFFLFSCSPPPPDLPPSALNFEIVHPNGSLLKGSSATVYVIEDGQKRGLISEKALGSQYRWAEKIQVSDAELARYPNGPAKVFRDGTLIKGSSATVWVIEDGMKRGFPSEAVFNSLKYKWSNILTVSDDEVSAVTTGSPITRTDIHPNGSLLKGSSATVYVIEDGQKRGLISEKALKSQYRWAEKIQVSDAELARYPNGPVKVFRDGTLIKGSSATVWVIEGGMKRGIASEEVFNAFNYKWSNILNISDSEVRAVPTGPSLNFGGHTPNFVVVWEDDSRKGGRYEIKARSFFSSGIPFTKDIKVSLSSKNEQYRPQVAMAQNGDFVVVWMDYRDKRWQIYARGFKPNGAERFAEIRVNRGGTNSSLLYPHIGMSRNGDFVVAWADNRNSDKYDIYIRGFNYDGSENISEKRISDPTIWSNRFFPAIGMSPNGKYFVVVWQAGVMSTTGNYAYRGGEGNYNWLSYSELRARGFYGDGTNRFEEIDVNAELLWGAEYWPSISVGETGDFVVAWTDERIIVRARYFLSNGTDRSGPIVVKDYRNDTGWGGFPSVAMEATSGKFFITWEDDLGNTGDYDIKGKLFDSQGSPLSSEITLNSIERGHQLNPDVAMNPENNDFVVVWQDNGTKGDKYEILAKGFASGTEGVEFSDITVNMSTKNQQLKPSIGWRPSSITSPKDGRNWRIPPIVMTALSGALYVIENKRLWRVDPTTGNYELRPGPRESGDNWVVEPIAMTVLDGALYVIENKSLWRVDPTTGNYELRPGPRKNGENWVVEPIAMTALDGALYVIENKRLWRVDPTTGNYELRPGPRESGDNWVVEPIAMTVLDGALYVIENKRLWRVDPTTGNYELRPGPRESGENWVVEPIAMTALDGALYVIENKRLWRVDPTTGNYDLRPGPRESGENWVVEPIKMTVLDGALYVIENQILYHVDPKTGNYKARKGSQG